MPGFASLSVASALRVASLNLCTDEYLLLLARPQEVVSVSRLSHDPLESPLWKAARRHHANRGSLEQVIGKRPTLILTMGGGGRSTAALAGRMGVRSLDLPFASSVGDVGSNLVTVAEALGNRGRATPWLNRLAALRRSSPRHAPDTIWLTDGGSSLSPGTPHVEWLRLAGLRQRALPQGRASLETLLLSPPRVLVRSDYRRGQVSRGQRWLGHPLVRRLEQRTIRTDGRAWTCAGPLMVAEIERLKAARR